YGPRQRPDLAIHKFARLMAAGRPIPVFGDGSSRRDYTYIDDILQGVLACTRQDFGFEIINLGESQTVSLEELIRLLEASMGEPARIDRLPARAGDVPITHADIRKARERLGYDPKVRIQDGIPRFVRWFRDRQEETAPRNP
ncbi:MAG TPA: GDP-mannose 4,6-dehydratase, partial [Candidatus Paceibacterota bacterium]|nr:GDP-mannose 4,6-dehydratase [Candidatus Paceibacterota bacterium]